MTQLTQFAIAGFFLKFVTPCGWFCHPISNEFIKRSLLSVAIYWQDNNWLSRKLWELRALQRSESIKLLVLLITSLENTGQHESQKCRIVTYNISLTHLSNVINGFWWQKTLLLQCIFNTTAHRVRSVVWKIVVYEVKIEKNIRNTP